MTASPIVLVPGFWLGAWAWDEVVALLTADGHTVVAVTLPGLESISEDRSSVTLNDHVDAICDVVAAQGQPVVLAVHSGAGVPGYQVTDRMPHLIANAVYVDTGPATGALDPTFEGTEYPLPAWEELGDDLTGFTPEHLTRFRDRSVPEPAGAIRDAPVLTDERRKDVPSTVICTSMTPDQIKEAVAEGYAGIGGLAELRHVTYLHLPTSHWPMWTEPKALAQVLSEVSRRAA